MQIPACRADWLDLPVNLHGLVQLPGAEVVEHAHHALIVFGLPQIITHGSRPLCPARADYEGPGAVQRILNQQAIACFGEDMG